MDNQNFRVGESRWTVLPLHFCHPSGSSQSHSSSNGENIEFNGLPMYPEPEQDDLLDIILTKRREDKKEEIGGHVLWAVIVIVSCLLTFLFTRWFERTEAARFGAGRWIVNEKTGFTRFKYVGEP